MVKVQEYLKKYLSKKGNWSVFILNSGHSIPSQLLKQV